MHPLSKAKMYYLAVTLTHGIPTKLWEEKNKILHTQKRKFAALLSKTYQINNKTVKSD